MVGRGNRMRCKPSVLPGICISYITFITAEVNGQKGSPSSSQASDSMSAVLERRQDSPSSFLTAPLPVLSSSSSSFDYWWPYPPASSQNPSDMLTSSSESADDESTSDLAPYIFASLTATLLPAYSSVSTSSAPTITASNGNLTLVNSYSIISITALPPVNTTSVNPHGSHVISGHQKPLNIVVLISIFVVIGVVLGAAFGWWSYGVFKARKKRMLAGSRYTGVNHNEDFDEKDGTILQPDEANFTVSDESESLLDRKSSRDTTFTSHFREGAQDVSEPFVAATSMNHWPHFSLEILKSPLITGFVNNQKNKAYLTESSSAYAGLEKSNRQLSNTLAVVVDRNSDTHLDVKAENPTPGIEDCISPRAPTVFESVATSDEDEDYELARRVPLGRHESGSVRQKSIRKRLAEKLQYFGLKQTVARRGTQKRDRTPEMEEGVLLQSDAESVQDSPSDWRRKKSSAARGWHSSHGRAISDFSLVDVNIQAPAATHLRDPHQSSPKHTGMGVLDAVRSYTSPLRPSHSDDKFTELPKRKRTTRRLKSARRPVRNSSPMADEEYDDEIGEKENKFILPASPPTVSSPQLESDLFFGATPFASNTLDSISSRQRVHNLREASESPTSYKLYGERLQIRDGLSGPRRMVKEASGLASYRGKALPPSPPRRASRRCSSNSPAKQKSRVAQRQRDRSGTVPSRPISPKERYEARRTALARVEAIVAQSWSARNMRGMSTPSSPTLFGAHVHDGRLEGSSSISGLMMGIEQTLER